MAKAKTAEPEYPRPDRGRGGRGIPPDCNITVEPIRWPRHIYLIKKLLSNRPRDMLLFTMGINNGLRIKDLLRIKVGQVRHLRAGQHVVIRESKTDKSNVLVVNKPVHRALHAYLANAQPNDADHLFASTRTGQALQSQVAGRMVKGWCHAIGLEGNYGAHTLRKTWAYFMRKHNQVAWELISTRLNHSSPGITMRYLGITTQEVIELLQTPVG